MHICILHIGFDNDSLNKRHKTSPERFINLLKPSLPEAKWTTIHCLEDNLPNDANGFDVYLITGGRYSVFEDLDWQQKLFDFIRQIYSNNVPLIGICYGHQAIAHALGGHVERFDNGWGAGVTTVNVIDQPAWLLPMAEKIYLLAMHQDQVTTIPTEATRFLDSHFCHNSGFYIDDRVLAIQQHPEFTSELCRDLIVKRKERIGKQYKPALQSLDIQHQGEYVGQWIANFINLRSSD
jgi:GMP synthase-like glutamine amidotransferase